MILLMHHVDALAAQDIAALFKVSPRTIQRRIAEARQEVLFYTRDILRERLKVDAHQVETIMRLLDSQLNASLAAIARDDTP